MIGVIERVDGPSSSVNDKSTKNIPPVKKSPARDANSLLLPDSEPGAPPNVGDGLWVKDPADNANINPCHPSEVEFDVAYVKTADDSPSSGVISKSVMVDDIVTTEINAGDVERSSATPKLPPETAIDSIAPEFAAPSPVAIAVITQKILILFISRWWLNIVENIDVDSHFAKN